MPQGAFKIIMVDGECDFNLTPRAYPIPDDQQELQHRIYDTWNLMKLLKACDQFHKDQGTLWTRAQALTDCSRLTRTKPSRKTRRKSSGQIVP